MSESYAKAHTECDKCGESSSGICSLASKGMNAGKTYSTRQRDAVCDIFNRSGNVCLSSAQVISLLRESGISIGCATVYRTLAVLLKEGRLQKFKSGQAVLYRPVPDTCRHTAHYHLQCTVCGSITHIECPCMRELEKRLLSEHGFKLDNVSTVLYGLCPECTAKKNAEPEAPQNDPERNT